MQYTGLISAKADVSSSLAPATIEEIAQKAVSFCIQRFGSLSLF